MEMKSGRCRGLLRQMGRIMSLTTLSIRVQKENQRMKTRLPIPVPQGSTPMEKLDWAFRTVLKVPKAKLLEEEKRIKRPRIDKTLKPA